MADYYALDDTLVGRIAQAGLVGKIVAVPDFIPAGGGRRTLARLGIGAVGVTAAALANFFDENPDNDEPARLIQEMGDDSVAKTWAVLGGGLLAGAAGSALAARCAASVAGRLRSRGVDKPHLLLGLLAAAGVFAASQIQHDYTARRSIHV